MLSFFFGDRGVVSFWSRERECVIYFSFPLDEGTFEELSRTKLDLLSDVEVFPAFIAHLPFLVPVHRFLSTGSSKRTNYTNPVFEDFVFVNREDGTYFELDR